MIRLRKSRGKRTQEIRRVENGDVSETLQREQLFLVAGHDEIRGCGQGAFQNHFIERIGNHTNRPLDRKNQTGCVAQSRGPVNHRSLRVIQSKFFQSLQILHQQLRAYGRPAAITCPGRQTSGGSAAPEACANDKTLAVVSGRLFLRTTNPPVKPTSSSSPAWIRAICRMARGTTVRLLLETLASMGQE